MTKTTKSEQIDPTTATSEETRDQAARGAPARPGLSDEELDDVSGGFEGGGGLGAPLPKH